MCSCCDQTTEDAGCCCISLKTMVYLLNAICWAAGGFLIYVGVEFLLSAGSLNEISWKPPIIIFSTAAVILIGGIFGCYGVYSQKKACLSIYLVFVTSVFIVMAVVAGAMIASRTEATTSFDGMVLDTFQQYSNSSEAGVAVIAGSDVTVNGTQFVDHLQTSLKCCGYNNYTDWAVFWNNSLFVPLSCCKSDIGNSTCTGSVLQKDLINLTGCKQPVEDLFTFCYKLFQWTSFGMAVLCLLALIAVIVFLCTDRTTAYYYSTLSPGYTEA